MLDIRTLLSRQVLIVALLITGNLQLFAQEKSTINGKTIDQQEKVVEYATILLFKQESTVAVRSQLSDATGKFSFTNIDKGVYKIQVSSMGYKTSFIQNINVIAAITDLPEPVVLETDRKLLNEINIVGSRPFLEQKVDRLVVNVGNSATSAGATAMEILKKVPGVIIINDHVNLSGKTGVVIMIDGKPSPYTDMEAMLKDIPGNNIEKIEVISNPGAQYEASGSAGIIDIILKKNRKSGLNGSYILGGGYSYYDQKDVKSDDHSYGRYSGALSLNYNNGKWNFFGSADFLHRRVFEVNNYDRIIDSSLFTQKNYYPYYYNTVNYRTGASYQLSEKSTLGILINGNNRSGNGTSTTYTTISNLRTNHTTGSFITENMTAIERFNLTGNLNYAYKIDTSGRAFYADFDYSNYKYKNTVNINFPVNNDKLFQLGKNPLDYLTFKANYTHPFSNGIKLDAGFKLSAVDIHNDLLFTRNDIVDQSQTNQFQYKENVQAAYLNLAKKYATFEYQIGLRLERTATKGQLGADKVLDQQYTQLFPSLSIQQQLSKNWKLNLAYSRRVDRPQFVLLSPFSYFIDSLTYSKGNPNLVPQLTHAGRLAIHYKNSFFIAFNYNRTNNTIYESAPQQIGIITYTQPDNLGTHDNAVMEINVPIALGNFITGYGDFQGIYNRYNAAYLNSVYKKDKFSFQSNINLSFRLSSSLKAEVNGFYTTGTLNEFMTTSSFSGIYLGLQKSMFNNRAKLNFSANDIFYKNSTISTVNYQHINTRYYYRDDSRNFRLTFSYSFGNEKSSGKADRDIGSKEENNRLRN